MISVNFLKVPSLLGHWANKALNSAVRLRPLNILNLQERQKSTKVDCKHLEPKCGDRFKQKPCDPSQQKIILKQPAPEPLEKQKRSIKLKHPMECCGDPCLNAYPRFDLLYYKRSDKLNRQYQQTWAECPELLKKPKVICCFEKIKHPQLKKRPRQQRPQTACKQTCASTNFKCPRINLRGCREAQVPPKCRPSRAKKQCKKRNAPFPAYSECSRTLPRPKRPIECRCLLAPSMCEAWAYYYYKTQRIKKIGTCSD